MNVVTGSIIGNEEVSGAESMTEWNAAAYASLSALQAAMAEEVLGTLLLSGDEQVLDVGCGNGKVTREIAARVPRGSVIGVDASAKMIEFAAANSGGSAPATNLRFQVADARRLGFLGQFDFVVSFNALHWIPEQELALGSIRDAMKPSGQAQLRLVPRGKRKSLENVLQETCKSPAWAEYFAECRDPYLHLSPEDYGALAEKCGLRVERIRWADKAWNFETREAFAAFGAVTFVEWSQHIPEERRPAFVTDALDRYREVATEKPGEENTFKFYQMDITLRRT
jgi:trans-aconitate 2-methyltransferase